MDFHLAELGAMVPEDIGVNSLFNWGVAVGITAIALVVLWTLRRFSVALVLRVAKRTSTMWDDAIAEMLKRTRGLAILIVALFLGSLSLELEPHTRAALYTVLAITLVVQGGIWLNALLLFWLDADRERRRQEEPGSIAAMNALGFISRLVLWAVVLLLVLDNLGIDITALVAGLGVGGIAVALAVQNVLGDLFASLSIALDKPFTVGDFLIIGDHLGSVENIGLKTTRLRSLTGEQLVFSNADLLGSRIRNYGRMFERRVAFKLGVTYQTPHEKIGRVTEIISAAIKSQEPVRFDRCHFQSYGDFALIFEAVYYVLSPDYNLYMDIQQSINLEIHARFCDEAIEFAYPTQTIHMAPAAMQAS